MSIYDHYPQGINCCPQNVNLEDELDKVLKQLSKAKQAKQHLLSLSKCMQGISHFDRNVLGVDIEVHFLGHVESSIQRLEEEGLNLSERIAKAK